MHKTDPALRQTSFAQAEYARKKKQTRRDVFLRQMQAVVPWSRLIAVIEPHYPKSGKRGRQPTGIERMLRMYFIQQWYGLADEAVEDAIYDSQALRDFCGIHLGQESVPDATTLMNFRHLLEKHKLPQALLAEVNALLKARGLLMNQGTLVDATLIAAPSSTKNKEHQRDPDMHQTKKGNEWHFGMKAHIGADEESGLVHTVISTGANVSDISQTAALMHGEEKRVGADAGYPTPRVKPARLESCGCGETRRGQSQARCHETRSDLSYCQAQKADQEHGRRLEKRSGAGE